MKIAVTGASGFLGTPLVQRLRTGGHDVVRFVRGSADADDERSWDPSTRTLDPAHLADVDAVIHLAGAGSPTSAGPTRARPVVLGSRVDGTTAVAQAVAASERTRVLLSSSAVGYYGDTGQTSTDETGPSGQGFLAEVCRQWEAATSAADADPGTRVAHLRTGIVLGRGGGALTPQLPCSRPASARPWAAAGSGFRGSRCTTRWRRSCTCSTPTSPGPSTWWRPRR
jgi:uncharacterized protein (TIGR01777 family)